VSPGILALHLKRYEFALAWSDGADVLDAGCGTGYGAAFLARRSRRVVGVDRSAEALEHARAHHAEPNLELVEADVLDLPFADASFDVVCGFETIEHLEDRSRFVLEAARVLRRDGTFLVSTPRAERTTRSPANPFHRVELAPADFERLLHEGFASVELYGQRRLQTQRHRLLQRLDVLGLRRLLPATTLTTWLLGTPPTSAVGLDGVVIERDAIEGAAELVAVCTAPRPR
jgi:SAM-dependent methyltransferase